MKWLVIEPVHDETKYRNVFVTVSNYLKMIGRMRTMKRITMKNQTKLIATKDDRNQINFYILTSKNEQLYAFTRPFSQKIWDLCKSGIRVNELMTKKSNHVGVMLLVKYTNYIMPYLCEEYNLEVA